MQFGAHVSSAVSLELAFDRAREIGAQCTQIFISPPQQWVQIKHSDQEIQAYKDKQSQTGIGPNFIHGTYLINLGTSNPEHLKKSIDWLIYSLNCAQKLGAEGVIFHLGSHRGSGFESALDQICSAISEVLRETKQVELILENSAGAGGSIGSKFSELGQIIKRVGDNRLKVCLDTQHAFATGYNWTSQEGAEQAIQEFDQRIGLDKLVAVHTNDSKVELGSNKDRHENIGDGFIGRKGFKNILSQPALADLPFILEVPGFGDTGPDKDNLDILHSLMSKIN